MKKILGEAKDFSDAPDEISKQAKWCMAVAEVCKQEQDIVNNNRLLVLWQAFWKQVGKSDLPNLTEWYKAYRPYK